LLGLSRGHQPKFAKRFANLGDAAVDAFSAFVAEVRSGAFPAAAHAYKPNARAAAPVASPGDDLDAPLALDLWH
jgi:3-methyl-2-oxobutanoate hydroxymethyltransferase